jgi:hypothetical protein
MNNPVNFNDPTGHCFSGIGIDTIACTDIAILVGLTVLAVATVYVVITPRDQVEKDMQVVGASLERATRRVINNIVNGFNALSVKVKKPLTRDEQEKVKHLEGDSEGFLNEHPDLAEEAIRKAEGRENQYDHVKEAENWVRGLQNDIDHLTRVRGLRDEEAQGAIDSAIKKGKGWIDAIKRKLRGIK